ncbi:MAG TPA: ADP-forming succinate--CoA ligase subunit beta [Polyangiaceae bacterium]|jgi:succinyl-CoA synthetase beta subunit|nr:ADP-forming succinate--CoA ligase subunit beta [Polyangiaceae bacterium]
MKLHEYQAKQIFARYGVAVPRGKAVFRKEDIEPAARALVEETGTETMVVKAQIHAGGRGKGGGVKVVTGATEAARVGGDILGMQLVTKQTGPEGQKVRRLYLEQGLAIARELYFAMLIDRETRTPAVIASTEGGVDIEEVAEKHPEKILTVHVDPLIGLAAFQIRQLAFGLGIPAASMKSFANLAAGLYDCFVKEDASLCEVNPLIVDKNGNVIALDGKMTTDDNASFRHPEWAELRDKDEEDPLELKAKETGISYVSLTGNIGCLVNGAGLAMATMDIIKHYGGLPANFLDVGGSASKEQVKTAFEMILSDADVKGIFVNIFGGIMQCDIIAEGVVAATKELGLKVPLVVRLEGNNVELGKKILAESGLSIQAADSMSDGAQKIVKAVSQ